MPFHARLWPLLQNKLVKAHRNKLVKSQAICLTMIVKGEFSNILFLCELVVASGQEERLIFTHFIPDYSHFLQNKLIKAHQNKLIKSRNENGREI